MVRKKMYHIFVASCCDFKLLSAVDSVGPGYIYRLPRSKLPLTEFLLVQPGFESEVYVQIPISKFQVSISYLVTMLRMM